MLRFALLLLCVALVTSCCIAQNAKKESLKCTLWQAGEASRPAAADSLAAIALRLLATADDELRLIVTPEMVEAIRTGDTALEIVFPKLFSAATAFGVQQEIDRVLIPLSGDYGPPPELSSAVILFGDSTGYFTGPNQNNFARPELLKLLELLKL